MMTSPKTAEAKPSAAPWVRNAWYVACYAEEIGAKPLGRTICAEPMVLFRTSDGVAALEDFCPHRGAPLSLGTLDGDTVVCGYHGLAMGKDGCAASMPNQRVSSFPSIRVFPAVERFGFVWVWPGEPALATLDDLPDLVWARGSEWAFGGGYYHVQCDYRLMIDNLMDLTHENYVHTSSIGQKEIDEAPVKTSSDDHEVITARFMENISAPPFWRMGLRGAGLPEESAVDRWQICRFSLPSHVMIDVGVALAGRGGFDAPDAVKAAAVVVDFMTPESETSHHYFWGMGRRFAVNDPAMTASIREGQRKIFAEDLEMLERQQRNISRAPERRLLKLNIDAGGVHSRRMIEKAIASESGEALPAAET